MVKRNLTLLIFLISITARADLIAQESENFFPHAVGDTWQYMYNDGRFYQAKVHRDSVDNLGNIFISILESQTTNYFWNYKITPDKDSIIYLPNSLRWLLYKFPVDSNEVIISDTSDIYGYYGKVNDIYKANIWGIYKTVIEINYFLGHPDSLYSGWLYTHKIAEGLGKIWYGDEVEYYSLIGCIIDGDTLGIIISDIETESNIKVPMNIKLEQNYPNPFNPNTIINYSIKEAGLVKLKVFDILGREVAMLVNETKEAGYHYVEFNASNLPSGVYIYTLKVNGYSDSKKMLLLK